MAPFNGFIQSKVHNTRDIPMFNKLSATVTVKNEILAKDVSNGMVIPATNSTVRSEIEGICNLDISSADALTQVPVIGIFEGDTWVADTTNNTNAAHNGQRMILTNALTVNNTGTDNASGVVEQVDVYGITTDKKAVFKFL